MKIARRYQGRKEVTLSVFFSSERNPLFLQINIALLTMTFLVFFLAGIFAFFMVNKSSIIQHKTTDYLNIKMLNRLQKIKIDLALKKNNLLKKNIHDLKVQEEEIKELLNINFDNENNYDVNLYNYPKVYTERIVTKVGEIGRVLIDERVVVEYFDNDKLSSAYQRAILTAERLKVMMAQKKVKLNFSIHQSGDKVSAYADHKVVFVVYPSDLNRINDPKINQKGLAKLWIKNIKEALANTGQARRLSDYLPFLDRKQRKKSELYRTIYTNINYPVHAAVLGSSGEESSIKNLDHMIKLAQQEIVTYKKSFGDLKVTIQSYKTRFAHTPSISPVPGSYILSGFGWRLHPILKKLKFHAGLDLPSWMGAPVRATADGVVVKSDWDGGYGKRVEIDHGYGFSTMYAHNSVIYVSVGQSIYKGQIIALVGQTGLAQGPHCHYEVHFFNRPINPLNFLNLNIFTASKNW